VTEDDMLRVLDSLGIEHVNVNGFEVQGFCPMHEERTGKQDRNPSWYINYDTGAHICFSCDFRGNIVSLVARMKGYEDWDEARSWLNDGGELSEMFERAIRKPTEIFEDLQYISEASLSAFVRPPLDALKSRGLTSYAADFHELLWDTLNNNWIIPQRELRTGKLMGWQEKGYATRSFKNYPTGIKKSVAMFGYDKYVSGHIIVVESPLDVVRLESLGFSGGVAIYGALTSDEQMAYIAKADSIIFALDNDQAGLTGSAKSLDTINKLGMEARFFNYSHTDAKDIGGMSKAEVIYGVESAVHSIRYGLGASA